MPLQKDLTGGKFLKFDTEAYLELSNNAKLVYLTFVHIHPNADPTDPFMAKQSAMGLSRYKKAKQELISKEYLYVQRLGAKGAVIVYHLGKAAVQTIKKKLKKKKVVPILEKVKKQPFLEEVEI